MTEIAPGGGRPGHAIDVWQKLLVALAALFVTAYWVVCTSVVPDGTSIAE